MPFSSLEVTKIPYHERLADREYHCTMEIFNMNQIKYCFKFFLCLIVLLWSIPGMAAAVARINISVSVLPQAYFVERIGGTRVNIQVMIPKGASPETYEPTPRQMVMLTDSDIYVKVGSPSFPFEAKYFNDILKRNKKIIVVNMSDKVQYRSGDPHVWVAPATVKIAAENIYQALSEADPLFKNYYKKNFDSFLKDIKKLDRDIRDSLAGKEGYSFMVFHPAWGYFADEYNLNQICVEEGGKTPSASHIRKMIDIARKKNIKIIFVQTGFDERSADVIAEETGGKVMQIDPLARNWLQNMKNVAKILSSVLKK